MTKGSDLVKGPVQFMAIAFPGNEFSGEIIPAVAEVIEKGIVRIIDLVFIRKDDDGNVGLVEFEDFTGAVGDEFDPLVDIVTGLIAEEDVQIFAEGMEANSSAVAIVFEHLWAAEIGAAVRRSNGTVVADGLIPRRAVVEILDRYSEAE